MKKRVFKSEKERHKQKRMTTRLVGAMNLNRGVEISVENAETNQIEQV